MQPFVVYCIPVYFGGTKFDRNGQNSIQEEKKSFVFPVLKEMNIKKIFIVAMPYHL